ncbi:uncharacterized protein BO95DRAFT_255688 [Aspergillus brunneoviolaceus CBS 621.78]|uniref:Uncharacterized protein n=1 Tax=Aspergillus brunneoviolaceus CBS 621.78 TaxID=1450534 RepID=A0ACD1FXY3_9EURO|nr:hypothetical protein BO95DRAFT_255688 [Aspergillus brunneoviolaceus CBS 621.78]RAH41824.1 hypothetical protein BO95DRAFT_255688 [Aspergillus brunneoviolaceus CBS 621.78]
MTTRNRRPHTVWLIGGGVESLVAASCLINEAKIPGNRIRILDSRGQRQPSGTIRNTKSTRKRLITSSTSHCQELPCASAQEPHQPQPLDVPAFHHDETPATCTRDRTEAFMAEPIHFLGHLGRKQVWRKNRKDILHFLLQDEEAYEGLSIQLVFDESFFDTYFWRLFSSSFGLRPSHSAVEFHRYISKYLDEVIGNSIQIADPLQVSLRKTVLQPLRAYLRNQGVEFHSLHVTDIHFHPDHYPQTASGIQAVDPCGNPMVFPVRAEDILIVTLGSAASGIATGTPASPPPALSTSTQSLLDDPSWALWIALAKKSSQCGNPASFCTHLPESRLGMFVIHLPQAEFNALHHRVLGTHPAVDATIAESNWSLKLVFPQQAQQEHDESHRSILGYGFTPDAPGHHIQKPMPACSGDEILAELLSSLNIPPAQIIPKARTVPYVLPLGLSPLLKRDPGDRPDITPSDLGNLALVGQYVEIPEETALMTEYSVRSAQLAVQRLMGGSSKVNVSEVHKSFLAARYGRKGGVVSCR